MEIKLKRLNANAVIPKRGSKQATGYDLHACIDKTIYIEPNETVMIGTGIAMELPNGIFGAIVARSGLSLKKGLAPANKIDICDSDYRGEYKVALHNHSTVTQEISPLERIAQLIIMPYLSAEFVETDKLGDTERGDGGFGSTGR